MRNFCFLFSVVIVFAANSCKKDIDPPGSVNKLPLLDVFAPANGNIYYLGDSVKFYFYVNDEDGKIVKMEFFDEEKLVYTDDTEPFEYNYFCNKSGKRSFVVSAYDDKGAIASQSTSITVVENYYIEFITYPRYNVPENSPILLTVDTKPPSGVVKSVELYVEDKLYAIDTVSPYYFVWDSVQIGNYTYYAQAIDSKGHVGRSSVQLVSVVPNKIPTIRFYFPSSTTQAWAPGQNINFLFEASDPDGVVQKIELFANDSLIATLVGTLSYTWINPPGGNYTLTAKAYDNSNAFAYADPLNITVAVGSKILGVITKLVASEDDHLVFGLNTYINKIQLIDAENRTSTNLDIPYSQAFDIEYSKTDQKLYILYKYSGILSVWDKTSQSFSIIEYSSIADGREIKLDEVNRRIYVLTDSGLFIIDMDSGAVLLNNSIINGTTIALDTWNRYLFTVREGEWNQPLTRYDVAGDQAIYSQSFYNIDYHPGKIAVNMQKGYLVVPHANNDNVTELVCYSTLNINDKIGGFTIPSSPAYSIFSADGSKLYATSNGYVNKYNQIYVMDAVTFLETKRIPVPNSSAFMRMCINNSGTKIIAFSFSSDGGNAIYFIDI